MADRRSGVFTSDGTVDLQGRLAIRAKTGRWISCIFMIVYEVFERIAYHGVASNLVLYYTENLHQGTVEAFTRVNYWVSATWLLPILGAYIADAHFGRYKTFVASSFIYLTGMGLLAISLKKGNHHGLFYTGLYVIAVGNGGTKPNISSMGADQFDENEPREKDDKVSYFNWWMCAVFSGSLIANTIIVYIQDKVNRITGYAIQTVGLGIGICIFLGGTHFYRHKKPQEISSYRKFLKVVVSALRKWRVPIPSNPQELHELDDLEGYKIAHSATLRFLHKAAVRTGSTASWMLCTVTQVEEAKQIIKMIPILISTIIPSAIFTLVNTLFIKQGATLDRRLVHGNRFEIPLASLKSLIQIFMLASLVLYGRLLVPMMRRRTGNPRGITLLQRMGIGMFIYIVIMTSAYLAERKRLSVARDTAALNPNQKVLPLSVFILLPQFALVGIADTFLEVAKLEFFYDQAPQGMKSLGASYYSSGMGLGSFFSVFILNVTSTITGRDDRNGWITNNLNHSHLDYYYLLMIGLASINFLYFLVVSRMYIYNTEPTYRQESQDADTL